MATFCLLSAVTQVSLRPDIHWQYCTFGHSDISVTISCLRVPYLYRAVAGPCPSLRTKSITGILYTMDKKLAVRQLLNNLRNDWIPFLDTYNIANP